MPEDPNDRARKIQPACKAFSDALTAEGLNMSAFIFSEDGFLINIGNSDVQGTELVKLHYYLAMMCVMMKESGDYSDFSLTDAPNTQDSASIALALAMAVITVPSDTMHRRVRELAEQYLTSVGE